MNIVYIIFNDVIAFTCRIPKLFVIMNISLLVSAFGVLFVFNLNEQLRLNSLQFDLSTKIYSIQFGEETDRNLIYETVHAIMAHQDLQGIDILEYQTISGSYRLTGYYRDADFSDWRIRHLQGRTFSVDELNSSDNLALISDGVVALNPSLPVPPVGAQLQVFDAEFAITGVVGFDASPQLWLPYKTFEKHGFFPLSVDLIFNQRLSDEQFLTLSQVLTALSHEAILKVPEPVNTSIQNQYYLNMAIVIVVLILASLNILSIFSYWIRFNRRQYIIYRICGATSIAIIFLVMAEVLLISTLMFGLAFGLYRLLTPIILHDLIKHAYSWEFFIRTFFIYQGCILLAICKTMFQLMTTTSLSSRMRMEV